MDLTVVIVNWNSTAFAAKCISSLLATIEDLEFEIVVVDNASPDGSSHMLQMLTPLVRLVYAGQNLGFSRANNLGVTHSNGKTILFLNPDTEVFEGAINRMYGCLKGSNNAGILGCRLLNADLSVQTSCIQRFPTISNQFTDIERLRLMFPKLTGIAPLFHPAASSTEVEAVSGACLMVKRDVFERVGRFSTVYFMYAEDIDLCYRVKQAGWTVCYVGSATVLHYGGQSSLGQERGAFSTVLTRESLYRFMKAHRGPKYATAYRVSTAIVAVVRILLLWTLSLLASVTRQTCSFNSSKRKWWKVLRWSLGLEQWAKAVGAPEHHNSAPVAT